MPAEVAGVDAASQPGTTGRPTTRSGGLGSEPTEEALASYERQRNEATAETYETTIQFAHLAPPPPEMEPLFAALRDNEEETGRFFGTVNGTVSAADFFAPKNISRIVGESRPFSCVTLLAVGGRERKLGSPPTP